MSMMADTNNSCSTTSTSAGGGGGTGATEAIPQWKKELIQRRKNLAKTIGTASTQVLHDSASTVAAALTTTPTTPRGAGPGGNPFGSSVPKDPSVVAPPSVAECPSPPRESTVESSASPASPVAPVVEPNSSTNSDSPASPTATTTPTSLFGAPVFVGHSHSSPVNEQPPVLVKSPGGTTNTATTRGTSEVLVLVGGGGTSAAEKQPLHTQSHSNDGPESTSGSRSSSNHLHSSALSGSPKKGGGGAPATNSPGPAGKYAAVVSTGVVSGISASSVDCELTRGGAPAPPEETNSYNSEIGWKLKKNTSSASSSAVSPNGSTTKMVAASGEEIIYEKNRFVGAAPVGGGGSEGGGTTVVDVDSSEELKYGPGIVSKLRCRYLSLALRQSVNKQRPSLNSMRRATSLNNLLDEESEDLSEREHSIDGKDHSQDRSSYPGLNGGKGGRDHQHIQMGLQQKAKTPDEYISTFQKSVQNSYTRSGRQTEKKNEYNRYNKQRGSDSLKRARSVEALVRYDHKAWERDIQKENLYSSNDSNVIILDEINTNGTGTAVINSNNICQTVAVAMNKADLIVDCVTIEDKIINGREKGDPKPKRLTSFIDADERPPPDVVRQTMKIFEANANRRGRPVARTNGAAGEVAAKVACYKSIISHEKPPITHPKPPLSPKKPNIIPRTTSPKSNGTTNNNNNNTANGIKEKPNLPKLDINTIRTNLETTNNLKNSATASPVAVQTPPSIGAIQNNTSTPLSVRVDPPSYRLKYDSPALSPNTTAHHKVASTTTTTATPANTTNRPESPRFSAAAAANMQNNTNSTAHTFVDSPSIQTLTSKLNQLNIATSTPTSTRSPTPSDPITAVPPQVPPRNILQYATSDEEDPDDPEDQQREYSINSDHGSDSHADDLELDDQDDDEDDDQDDEPDTIARKVPRSAMDNISKAGVTTQFRFNGQPQNKSHLPSLGNSNSTAAAISGGGGGAKLLTAKKLNVDDHLSSNSSSTSSSPITVPVVAAAVVTQKPPVPLSRESLAAASSNGLKPNNSIGSVTAANSNLNHLNSSNANTSVNSKLVINANGGNNANGGGLDSAAAAAAAAALSASSNVSSDVKTVNLTAREIEKNQINLEKSEESISSASAGLGGNVVISKPNNNGGGSDVGGAGVVGTTSAAAAAGGDFFMAKWGSPVVATAVPASAASGNSPNPLLAGLMPTKKKVKAPPPPIEANTMVFNFSDRKEVPDYIENDGIILRPRPRELPKPGESGFVVLGDLTLETSTDPDDSWAMGPPSPCDVEFENANIVINGKSSMRNKTSGDNKFKIQFDDSLTSTFEYPSETSLLDANGSDVADIGAANNGLGLADAANGAGGGLAFGDNGLLSHKNTLLSSMPLGSAPFASYTPVKAAIDTTFELGVTRTPSPSSTASSSTASSTSSNSSSSSSITTNNEHHQHLPHQQQLQQQSHNHHLHSNNGGSLHASNGHHQHHQQQLASAGQDRLSGTDSNGLLLLNGETGEPESIQYLKPASDEQTVNWSQGTRVTDLLF